VLSARRHIGLGCIGLGRIGLGLLAVAVPLAAGCTDVGDPASAQGLSRNDLVADLAEQLAGSAALTYAATYQLAGGATATIAQAQRPLRAAYRYPGGAVLVTSDATTHCAKQTCTMTAPATPPPAGTFADARKAGLITPAAVVNLLNEARIDPDVTIDQHDTTVAGRHATCVKLTNVDVDGPSATRPSASTPSASTPSASISSASTSSSAASSASTPAGPARSPSAGPQVSAAQTGAGHATQDQTGADQVGASPAGTFSTCITSDGMVGSFTGALQGTPIDVALTNYNDQVAGNAFDPPPAAKLVDHRTK
jgi:hypothetical protein